MNARSVGIVVILAAAAVAPLRGADAAQQRPNPPTTAAADVTSCAQAQMVVDQLLATAMVRMDAARQTNAAADLRGAVDSLQSTIRDARAQLAPCATATPDQPMDHSKMPMGNTPAVKPGTAKPPAAPMDHSKMPMGAPPAAKPGGAAKPAATVKPATAAPMDHSKMPMGATPAAKPAAAPAGKPTTSGAAMDHSKMAMGQPADTTQQAVDPVCGLKVDPASAPQATHQGRAYSFCSEQHRELFQKTPAKYLPKGK